MGCCTRRLFALVFSPGTCSTRKGACGRKTLSPPTRQRAARAYGRGTDAFRVGFAHMGAAWGRGRSRTDCCVLCSAMLCCSTGVKTVFLAHQMFRASDVPRTPSLAAVLLAFLCDHFRSSPKRDLGASRYWTVGGYNFGRSKQYSMLIFDNPVNHLIPFLHSSELVIHLPLAIDSPQRCSFVRWLARNPGAPSPSCGLLRHSVSF